MKNALMRKLTKSQLGWLDSPLQGPGIPSGGLDTGGCWTSARTDDRNFVPVLNEAMAVVILGEPITRARVDWVKMLVHPGIEGSHEENASRKGSRSRVSAFVPRLYSAGCSAIRCCCCMVVLCYAKLMSYWTLQCEGAGCGR